jgi:hypothetical protein
MIVAPVQIAYHVPDPAAAAERCARDYGWGPFFLMEHIPLVRCRYRDGPGEFDHTSAYGQAGDIMVELITQHGDAPSALRDLYAAHESGIHHVAQFVDSLPAALERFRARGVAVALEARTATGVDFAMVDTSATLGHMLELYEAGAELKRFYAYVKRKAQGWDGADPVRRLDVS